MTNEIRRPMLRHSWLIQVETSKPGELGIVESALMHIAATSTSLLYLKLRSTVPQPCFYRSSPPHLFIFLVASLGRREAYAIERLGFLGIHDEASSRHARGLGSSILCRRSSGVSDTLVPARFSHVASQSHRNETPTCTSALSPNLTGSNGKVRRAAFN